MHLVSKSAIILLVVIVLSGCMPLSPLVPKKATTFENLIPADPRIVVEDVFDFALEYFPDKCAWYKVDHVVDGDTIKGEWLRGPMPDSAGDSGEYVRLVGIDTPEVQNPYRNEEPYGPEASAMVKTMIQPNDEICVIYDPVGRDTDNYGRTLGYVLTADGLDVNVAVLQAGMAEAYRWGDYIRQEEFGLWEDIAVEDGVGMWGE